MGYNRLLHDPQSQYAQVIDCEYGDYDITQLWKAQPLAAPIPFAVRMTVDDTLDLPLPDMLYNVLSWWIVSKRLYECVEDLVQDAIQLIDAPVYRLSNNERIQDYRILNILSVIDCIDKHKTKSLDCGYSILYDQTPTLVAQRALGHHLFRLYDDELTVIASDDFISRLKGRGFLGISYCPLDLT